MHNELKRPHLFSYTSFRLYVEEMVVYLKRSRGVSAYRISKRALFKSPSYLKMIIKGERSPSQKMARQLAWALDLNESEQPYFLALLEREKKSVPSEQEAVEREMEELRSYQSLSANDQRQYHLASRWYAPVILESLRLKSPLSVEQLAEKLHLPPSNVEAVLHEFERLGLVKKIQSQWRRTGIELVPSPQAKSIVSRRYRAEMAQRAIKYLAGSSPLSKNDLFEGITLALTTEQAQILSSKILRLVSEVNQIKAKDLPADSIYQLNLQFIKLLSQQVSAVLLNEKFK